MNQWRIETFTKDVENSSRQIAIDINVYIEMK